MTDKMQTIIITLSDGTKHPFTGPAAIFEGGPEVVTPITVYPPKDMPPGTSWETIKPEEATNDA